MGYAETESPQETICLLQGATAPTPVYIHHKALVAFAQAAGIALGRALIELGSGILRWKESERPGEKGYAVRLRGAPNLPLVFGYLDGCLLVHHLPEGMKDPNEGKTFEKGE
jgi:hypothetical protein